MRLCWLGALLVGACSFGDVVLGEIDPETIPDTPTYELHIKPMMEYYCVSCHHGDVEASQAISLRALSLDLPHEPYSDDDDDDDDDGDPNLLHQGIEPDLSTYELLLEDFEEVAEEMFEDRTMPPGASRRLTAREEAILTRWAAIGFPR